MPLLSIVKWWLLTFASTWCLFEVPSLAHVLVCYAPTMRLQPGPAQVRDLESATGLPLELDLAVVVIWLETVGIHIVDEITNLRLESNITVPYLALLSSCGPFVGSHLSTSLVLLYVKIMKRS